MCPWEIVKAGCPVILTEEWHMWAFVLAPAFLAAFGAIIGQGSWLRIVTAAAGAAARDLILMGLVMYGWLVPCNPSYTTESATMMAFGCASGAALLACLSPYRGKILILMSGAGAFAGQFLILALGARRAKDKYRVV